MTKASKSNRFSQLFKDGASITNSFAGPDRNTVDSKIRIDNNEFEYDNLAKGTEAERILSARNEDKDMVIKNFDSNYQRMLKLESSIKSRKDKIGAAKDEAIRMKS